MPTLLLNSYKSFTPTLPHPPKKQGGSEEISKKMRNFVGAFDCIDKLKYALRRSFEPQKQRFTLVFSVPGANILNKVKNKQNEA